LKREAEEDTATHMQPPVGRLVLALNGTVVTESLLAPGRFVIGRTSDNDLQIDSKFVSRHHAQVVTTRDGSSIEDLNSTNGIFVRGRRIRRSKLVEGDVVKIGVHELIYQRIDGHELAEE
jgi:pSer/pThr/pTyr-binding forkhead associated (FHA) protein